MDNNNKNSNIILRDQYSTLGILLEVHKSKKQNHYQKLILRYMERA